MYSYVSTKLVKERMQKLTRCITTQQLVSKSVGTCGHCQKCTCSVRPCMQCNLYHVWANDTFEGISNYKVLWFVYYTLAIAFKDVCMNWTRPRSLY